MNLTMSNARRAVEHAKAMAQPQSEDVRIEAKRLLRLLRLRCMTIGDLGRITGLGECHWKHRLSQRYRFTPGLLRHFLKAIDATPEERTRLTRLAARADGWEV